MTKIKCIYKRIKDQHRERETERGQEREKFMAYMAMYI